MGLYLSVQCQISLMTRPLFHNKIMKRETINRVYRKPPLSLICPTHITRRPSPAMLLTQALDTEIKSQQGDNIDQMVN